MSYRIKCVEINNACEFKDCRKIKLIGVLAQGGGVNKYPPARIYERINDGEEFFILNGPKKTFLIKAEREGTKYVRTEPNDTEDDNLLKQSAC